MDDGLAVAHRVLERAAVAEVPADVLDALRAVIDMAQVEDPREVAGGEQVVDHVGSDEPGSSGDQHARATVLCRRHGADRTSRCGDTSCRRTGSSQDAYFFFTLRLMVIVLVVLFGVPPKISAITVTLRGFAHDCPDDVDIVLVGPDGTAVKLMSDAGGTNVVSGVDLTFDQSAAAAVPDTAALTSGTFQPADYDGRRQRHVHGRRRALASSPGTGDAAGTIVRPHWEVLDARLCRPRRRPRDRRRHRGRGPWCDHLRGHRQQPRVVRRGVGAAGGELTGERVAQESDNPVLEERRVA
jgi:hypothetical protein